MMFSGDKLSVKPLEGGFFELRFDAQDASVNVFNEATVAELKQALDCIAKLPDIKGLLITSAKKVFLAGADITEFAPVFSRPAQQMKAYFSANNENLNTIEDLPFPTVVAINGFALGGGLEFCLACDQRVISTKAKVGLPETGLGLIPGWGGTVRAPRLMGLENAMQWIASAKHFDADAALTAGVVDIVVAPEKLYIEALHALKSMAENFVNVREGRLKKTTAMSLSLDAAKGIAAQQLAGVKQQLKAPKAAITHLMNSITMNRAEAIAAEAQVFIDLAATDQARALVGNFVNEQLVNQIAKRHAGKSTDAVEVAAVIGAGIMGGGIAYQNAINGVRVVMRDIQQAALDLGISEVDSLLSKNVRRGRITEQDKAEVLANIKPSLVIDDIAQANVIVEAVVENPKVKEVVLPELEESVSESAVLASNTSTLSISRLANVLKRPENFAGLHFFNPVHAMPLVEVIRAKKTGDETIATLVAYALQLGKKPIVVNDCPAFLVNRVLFPYFRGFEQLVSDGVHFQTIDSVMEDWGWPMGPAYLADVIGIDTVDHCQDVLAADIPGRMARLPYSIVKAMYSAERFGQKNSQGFYDYIKNDKGRIEKCDSDTAKSLSDEIQQQRESVSDEDIVIRCMLPMAIEMARCLEEGIVESPAEADMSLLYGLGFPNFRGGIVRWMDEIGLATVCEWSDRFSVLGEAYAVTDTMRTMAANQRSYYE